MVHLILTVEFESRRSPQHVFAPLSTVFQLQVMKPSPHWLRPKDGCPSSCTWNHQGCYWLAAKLALGVSLTSIEISLSSSLSTASLCFASSHSGQLSVWGGDPWSPSPTSPVGGECRFPHSSSKVPPDSSWSKSSLRHSVKPMILAKGKENADCLSLGYMPCCRWDWSHLSHTDWEWKGSIVLERKIRMLPHFVKMDAMQVKARSLQLALLL